MKKLAFLLLLIVPSLQSLCQTNSILVLSDVHVELSPAEANPADKDADTMLFTAAVKSVGAQKFPFIIMPGDLMPHGNAHDTASMKKTLEYVIEHVQNLDKDAIILPALGNNDCMAHNTPDDMTYEVFYGSALKRIDKDSSIYKTFKKGGYYQYTKDDLSVIVLNTLLFASFVHGQDSAAKQELCWLGAALQNALQTNRKVWIVYHVPPGIDRYNNSQSWHQAIQEMYIDTIKKYAPIIKFQLAGHTHMNDYRLITHNKTIISYIDIAPGLNTRNGNNPAYQIVDYNVPDKTINEVKTYFTNASYRVWDSFSFKDFNFDFLLNFKENNPKGVAFVQHYSANSGQAMSNGHKIIWDDGFAGGSVIKAD
ncbi:hypothetical protein F0919_17155 [Taibaiella lutea]|uniref:Calcineurin-like phosphoesterase domain-containing protein n=1 Tax=Taibaiella lutea TaxID=2608001 RepID=A0A5M6CBT3_9BACT|nr:hypothetical protein [Taibaiella lutea]KAA5532511.1 hypothetical protein F0919_17155 [Taibaiella lutea]